MCLGQLKTPPPKEASPDEPDFMALMREYPRKSHGFMQRFIWTELYRAIFKGAGGIWCAHMSSTLNTWRVAITGKLIGLSKRLENLLCCL
jgi:hypothetical protein